MAGSAMCLGERASQVILSKCPKLPLPLLPPLPLAVSCCCCCCSTACLGPAPPCALAKGLVWSPYPSKAAAACCLRCR